MTPQTLTLRCADGLALTAREYAGGDAGALVISPALGVPQGYYAAYAEYLASRGHHVLTYDNRGFGDSAAALRGSRVQLADWGRQDLEAALQRALQVDARVGLIGHSLGCQLPGLAPSSERLGALVLVAGTAPHPRLYPPRERPALWLLWNLIIPVLTRLGENVSPQLLGLGKGLPLPSGAAAGWARWARSRDYLFDASHGLDLSGYARIRAPLLAWNFDDDAYAPRAAVEALLRHYSAATIERRNAEGYAAGSVGHFGYFRSSRRDSLWRATADWLAQQASTQTQPERARA